MNVIQKYQEFIDSFEEMNKRYEEEISRINEDYSIPNDTKEFMISKRIEYIKENNKIVDELKGFIEKATNF